MNFLITLICFFIINFYSFSNLYVKGNFALNENLPSVFVDNLLLKNDKKHTENGLIIEYILSNVYKNTDIGIGTGYVQFTSYKNTELIEVNSIINYKIPRIDYVPIYIIFKQSFFTKDDLNIYLKSNIGYSFNISNDYIKKEVINKEHETLENFNFNVTNGIYFNIGVGIEYINFIAEISYVYNDIDYSVDNHVNTFDRNRFILSLGAKIY